MSQKTELPEGLGSGASQVYPNCTRRRGWSGGGRGRGEGASQVYPNCIRRRGWRGGGRGRGERRRLLLATFHVIYLVKSPDLGDRLLISVGSVCTPTAMKVILTARQT